MPSYPLLTEASEVHAESLSALHGMSLVTTNVMLLTGA